MLHIQSQLSYSFITRHFSHYKSSCGVTCKKKSDKLRHKSSSSDKNCTVHSVSLIDQEQKRMATDSRKSWNKWRKKKKKKETNQKTKQSLQIALQSEDICMPIPGIIQEMFKMPLL